MVVKMQFRKKKSCLGHPVYWAKITTSWNSFFRQDLDPSKTNVRSFLTRPSEVQKQAQNSKFPDA